MGFDGQAKLLEKEPNAQVQTDKVETTPFHDELYETQEVKGGRYRFYWNNGGAYDYLAQAQIAQEARTLGLLLDTGNAQLAAMRLQSDLVQLRPNRYAQNMLLTQLNLSDRKGIGSDLVLGYYDPFSASFSQGYIVQSRFRPFPTYPVYY